eukprot:scaffold7020_cov214-Amphora_coffeaeformis.AAC.2
MKQYLVCDLVSCSLPATLWLVGLPAPQSAGAGTPWALTKKVREKFLANGMFLGAARVQKVCRSYVLCRLTRLQGSGWDGELSRVKSPAVWYGSYGYWNKYALVLGCCV